MSNENENDIYRNIQLISLENFLNPDEDVFYRRLCRWFATEFHTSLFEVEQKPLEYLLMHYFEYKYEKMNPEDFVKQKRFLLYKEEVVSEEDDDEAFAEQIEAEFIKRKQEELKAAQKQKEQEKSPEPLPPDISIKF